MAHDALGAHARDELGIWDTLRARPLQAALASAASFAVGAAAPLIAVAVSPGARFSRWLAAPRSCCWAGSDGSPPGRRRPIVVRRVPRGVLGGARDGGDRPVGALFGTTA